ncbi:VanZ family protein [Agromyces sp. SYSU T0242]|uniref:VanZ family protein n=1 Tax=Agromyces litoreus TaxID=3158561 RepID=UPI0033995CDF
MRPSRLAVALLFAYVPAVLWVTLGPAPGAVAGNQTTNGVLGVRTWLDADTWAFGSSTEFALNVLLFVPLGALLAFALRGVPALAALVIASGFALLIEVGQIPMDDRISDPRDLIANSLGALIGILLARLSDAIASIPARIRTRRRAARMARAMRAARLSRAQTDSLRAADEAHRTGRIPVGRSN